MKVLLLLVTSLDGRITEGERQGTQAWASSEDQEVFQAQINTHDCIVMGSATYEAARAIIQPRADKPRIVLTRTPKKFANEYAPGLEFTADSPAEIIRRAAAKGCESVLLVGGSHANARFINAGLVDEVLVSIEPLLFGAGTPFVAPLRHTAQLQLLSHRQLNDQGTLLLHYRIQNPKQGTMYENKKI